MVTLQPRLPLDSNGFVPLVLASVAATPFRYLNSLKLDATGAVVISG